MKIAVLGSGAVGGYYGAKLARAGHDVTFIARGAHLAAIRARGLEIRSPVLGDFTVRAPAEEDTTRVGPVDVVLYAVKTYDNASALPMLMPMIGEQTSVLTVQNGVDSATELTLDTPQALAAIEWFVGLGITDHNVVPTEAEAVSIRRTRSPSSAAASDALWKVPESLEEMCRE